VIGKTDSLLYRRGNFNGTWDDLICQGIMEERDTQIALSPGFRWGTTLLPGQDITIDDLYSETSMSYPSVYRLEFTGAQLKDIMEDVCDNLFNKDPVPTSRAATWSGSAAWATPARRKRRWAAAFPTCA
jgi:sulfur-oxidizing protein SoxB